MAASGNGPRRKRRYVPSPPTMPVPLTPLRLMLLRYPADMEMGSTPQLARLAAISCLAVQRQMRPAFDEGLVRIAAVPRVAVADPETATSPALAYGSTANVYQLSQKGVKLLAQLGYDAPPSPAHELGCRDMLIWLRCCARAFPGLQPLIPSSLLIEPEAGS